MVVVVSSGCGGWWVVMVRWWLCILRREIWRKYNYLNELRNKDFMGFN